jgi:hypothetical protein
MEGKVQREKEKRGNGHELINEGMRTKSKLLMRDGE